MFYGDLVCLMDIWSILWLFGILFRLGHIVTRKIWQTCLSDVTENYPHTFVLSGEIYNPYSHCLRSWDLLYRLEYFYYVSFSFKTNQQRHSISADNRFCMYGYIQTERNKLIISIAVDNACIVCNVYNIINKYVQLAEVPGVARDKK
jgi:hypothetical protein